MSKLNYNFCWIVNSKSNNSPVLESQYSSNPVTQFLDHTWGWVKTLSPFCSHQNSWDLWMFIPLKMVYMDVGQNGRPRGPQRLV